MGLWAPIQPQVAQQTRTLQPPVNASLLNIRLQESDGARSTFILPTEAAWQALGQEAAAANVTLTPELVDSLMNYLYTGAEVADVIDDATPVKTALSLATAQQQKAVCPKGTNATIVFAYDTTSSNPDAAAGAATGPVAPAAPTAPAAAGGPGMGAGPALGGPATAPAQPAAVLPGLAAAAPAGPSAPVTAAAGPGMPGTVSQLMNGGLRRLHQTKLPTTADSLILPTTFTGPAAAKKKGSSVISGPVMIVDGAAIQLQSGIGIPVDSITYGELGIWVIKPISPLLLSKATSTE